MTDINTSPERDQPIAITNRAVGRRRTAHAGVARALFAEFLGTGLLVTIVVGSGIAAASLSPGDIGLQLLENSTATALGLTVLILALGPVSGAHLNPAVSLVDCLAGRRARTGLSLTALGLYTLVQCLGAVAGAVLANVMFGVSTTWSTSNTSPPPPAGLVRVRIARSASWSTATTGARCTRSSRSRPTSGARTSSS